MIGIKTELLPNGMESHHQQQQQKQQPTITLNTPQTTDNLTFPASE